MNMRVNIPRLGWTPRPHQMPLWNYLHAGGKRAIAVWHRRAGKDEIALHHTAVSAFRKIGNYWHCLPEYAQARKAIWTAVNPHTGARRIDEAFPLSLRESTNDHEMFIRLINGSTFQCIGSDQYSRTVGSSAAGVVFSEYALSNPSAWAYMRPMLEENDGWAVFITTPRGRNHAKALYDYAAQRDDWFSELLPVSATGALSVEQQANALAEYKALYGADAGQAAYDQEYEVSFSASIPGSFYAAEMALVRAEGRIIADVEALPDRPVHRAWDLGVTDSTSIWLYQAQGGQIVMLDHITNSGVGVEWYRDELFRLYEARGWTPMLVPLSTVEDGINAVRRMLPLCIFHPRCEDGGVSALEQYRREWDDDKKCFKPTALHDWTSHPADAFRYLAMSYKPAPPRQSKPPKLEGWVIPQPLEQRRGIRL